MDTAVGRRLRPLALICALLFVLWGLASGGALISHILAQNEVGWPDEDAPGEVVAWVALFVAAAATGCWVALWGALGMVWRPPLHLGALALLVAVGLEVAANLVIADFVSGSFGGQLEWYVDRVTFQTDGRVPSEWRAFFTALPLVTAPLPFLVYLAALFSGAGRKPRVSPYAAPTYPNQPGQPPPPPPRDQPRPQHQPRSYPPPPPPPPPRPNPPKQDS